MPKITFDLPVLRSARLTLRPAREGELEMLAEAIAADPAAGVRWSTNPATNLGWFSDECVGFLVIEFEGKAAGVIDFEEQCDPAYRSAGIDIALLLPYAGKGLGTEAVQLLAAWLVDERGHHRLTIDPAADNAPAIHTYEKVGYRPIGIARRYERGSDGRWHDNLLMDLLAEELVRLED